MKKIQVSVYLEPETHEALSILAKATHSSVGEMLHQAALVLVQKHMDNGEIAKAQAALQALESVQVNYPA